MSAAILREPEWVASARATELRNGASWAFRVSEKGRSETPATARPVIIRIVFVTTTYAYDNAHNRTAKTVTQDDGEDVTLLEQAVYTFTNNLNQISVYHDSVSGRTVGFTYDLNGNRVQRAADTTGDSVADEITVYTYDAENRLLAHEKTSGGVAEPHQYAYDYRTRRVLRDESGAGGDRTLLVFSGGLSVQEWTVAPAAVQPDPAADILDVLYVRGSDYGGGIGGVLYTLRDLNEDGQLNNAAFNHYNSRGDVVARMDDGGALMYQAAYEAFGRHGDTPGTQEWGGTADRQQANTKDEDPTGLLNEGFRYRCLETGVFITRDPLGFVDGPNVYTYVVQNPWTFFDPLGLEAAYGHPNDANEKKLEIKSDVNRMLEQGKDSDTLKTVWGGMEDSAHKIHITQARDPRNPTGGAMFNDDGSVAYYYAEYLPERPDILAHEIIHALQKIEKHKQENKYGRVINQAQVSDPLALGVYNSEFDDKPFNAYNPLNPQVYRYPGDTRNLMQLEGPAVRVQNRVIFEMIHSGGPAPDALRNTYPWGDRGLVVVDSFGTGINRKGVDWRSLGREYDRRRGHNYERRARERNFIDNQVETQNNRR